MRRFLIKLTVLLLVSLPFQAVATISFESIEDKTPGEQYRQLSLLMLMTGGTDPALLEILQPVIDSQSSGQAPAMELELDDYVTPLIRIVDPEILLGDAAQAFRFAYENGEEIQARLTRIATENPILVSMVDVNQLAADAIIIRNSIADTIEYTDSIDAEDRTPQMSHTATHSHERQGKDLNTQSGSLY